MRIVRKSVGIVSGIAAVGLFVIVWGLNAGPLEPSAPPASTMRSLQEVYDLTNSLKGAALPVPLYPFQSDLYLLVDGIPGDSQEKDHRDWIDAFAFHWGISRPGQLFPVEGRPPTPVANHADLTIVKRIDKSSPKLFLFCCSGSHIPRVKFEIMRIGERPSRILLYELEDVIVTSVKPVGATLESSYLMEEVAFNYAQIKVSYTGVRPDGTLEHEITAGWDRQENRQY